MWNIVTFAESIFLQFSNIFVSASLSRPSHYLCLRFEWLILNWNEYYIFYMLDKRKFASRRILFIRNLTPLTPTMRSDFSYYLITVNISFHKTRFFSYCEFESLGWSDILQTGRMKYLVNGCTEIYELSWDRPFGVHRIEFSHDYLTQKITGLKMWNSVNSTM